MPAYRLRRDGQQYLVFSGELLADASDRLRHGQEHDSWTEMRVYRTTTATYVVEEVARTLWQKGEGVRYKAEMYATPQEVYAALGGADADAGLGDLEKDLLAQLATQDPGFAGMRSCAKAHPSTRVPELQSHEARQAVTAAVCALLLRWRLQDATQGELLGILDMGSVHQTGLLPDDAAVLERAGHLLAIGRALDRLYPDQPAAVAWWMRAPYQDFGGLSALTLMRTGVEGIKRVRTHIESWLKTPATE